MTKSSTVMHRIYNIENRKKKNNKWDRVVPKLREKSLEYEQEISGYPKTLSS